MTICMLSFEDRDVNASKIDVPTDCWKLKPDRVV